MTSSTSRTAQRMTTERLLTELVGELEALERDAPTWVDAFAAAEKAIFSDRCAAERALFPIEIVPVTGDAIQLYGWYIARFSATSFATELATLHLRSVSTHPELAALCRSHDALCDVAAAAGNHEAPGRAESYAAAALRAGERARRAYQLAIARQLAGIVGHELAAAARLLIEAEQLAERLGAAKRRAQHLAAPPAAEIEAAS